MAKFQLSGATLRRAMIPVIAALLLGAVAGIQAVVGVTQANQPALAATLIGGSGVSLASEASFAWKLQPTVPAAKQHYARLARAALRREPLNPSALRVLGYYDSDRGQLASARRELVLGEKLSRRDFFTQVWFINDKVKAGDAPGALKHFDTALRSSDSGGQVLYPVLAKALSDPRVQRAVAPYIRQKDDWVGEFVAYALDKREGETELARMFANNGGAPNDTLGSTLLSLLVVRGSYDEARRYYLSMPGAAPGGLHEVSFAPALTDSRFIPVSWQPLPSDTLGADLVADEDGARAFEIVAVHSMAQPALRKLLMLASGSYSFAANVVTETGDPANAGWTVSCLRAGAPAAEIAHLRPAGGSFSIPTGCQAQFLDLVSGANAGGGEQSFIVKRPLLVRR